MIFESLECRQLMAFAVFDPSSSSETGDVSSVLGRGVGKGTHSYRVNDQSVGMSISSTKIAIDPIATAVDNPSLLAEFGLRSVRSTGSLFSVYETDRPMDAQFVQTLVGSGLAERVAPVFTVIDTGSDAVLLNEAIVALRPGELASDYFSGRSEFTNHRRLDGTSEQFVVTLAAGYGEQALQAIGRLTKDPQLAWAAPNFYQSWQKFAIPNDPRFGNQWHLNNIGQGGGLIDADSDLPEAWDVIPGGSADITIGVVDDGVATNHPDLRPWINVGETPGNAIDDDGNGWVDDVNGWNFVANNNISNPTALTDAHGTAVAGVAAAIGNNSEGVAGASYRSAVLSARMFEGNGVASDAGIAGAIYYAAGRKANGSGAWKAADLTNHSWGGGAPSAAIDDALDWATSSGREGKGSTQLFAAGNSNTLVGYPATQAAVNPGIVVVGAMNNLGEKSDYSSFGPFVDIVTGSNDTRPGYLAIDTTDRIGPAGYVSGEYTGTGATGFGGTSSAAPLATGITALAIARGAELGLDLTPRQLRDLLRVNTKLMGADEEYPAETGKSFFLGYGLLSAETLVEGIGKAEISVIDSRQEYVDGVTVKSIGTTTVGDYIDLTLRIRNQGTSDLVLGVPSLLGGDFSIAQGPSDSVLGLGQATTLVVRFEPQTAGSKTTTLTIPSSDEDEPAFAIDIDGVALSASLAGVVFEDWNGDGIRQSADSTLPGRTVFLDSNINGLFDTDLNFVNYDAFPNLPISDFTTSSSSIVVADVPYAITDVDVMIDITHTWVSDLKLTLIAPNGQRILLVDGLGGSGDDFSGTIFDSQAAVGINQGTAPFLGRYRPQQSLSRLNGLDANGTWKIEVKDSSSGDVGLLNEWQLSIYTGEVTSTTNANGRYFFLGLPIGSYSAAAVVPTGWTGTNAVPYSFEITSPNDSFGNINFGMGRNNRFYGQVFEDANGDGAQDMLEPGAAGRKLFWDLDGDGQLSGTVVTSFTDSTVVPILDNQTSTSTQSISGITGIVSDINLEINVFHTWDSDLDAYLIGPDGTRVLLFSFVGGSGDNFTGTIFDDEANASINSGTAPFTGRFRPQELLSVFDGMDPNGDWTVEITDFAFADEGSLNSWTLTVRSDTDIQKTTNAAGRAFFDLPTGSQSIGLDPKTGWVNTIPVDGFHTANVVDSPLFAQDYGTKTPPMIAVDSSNVSGFEGDTISQTGTWVAPYGIDSITLSASVGSVLKNTDGTWSWSLVGLDDLPPTNVVITSTDSGGTQATTMFTYEVFNADPILTVAQPNIVGNVLATLTNSGTWQDVASDTVTLTASLGDVVKNADGSWSWSYVASTVVTGSLVTITGTDGDGGSSDIAFTLDAMVAIVNSRFFYNNSGYESTDGVSAALDSSRSFLRPGTTSATTSAANIINYTRGINGVVLDIAGLVGTSLNASDFVFRVAPAEASGVVNPSLWASAPVPTTIDVTPGTSTTAARVRLEWPDNAIENTWLQIIVQANSNTGLVNREVYYLGHALGDVDRSSSPYRVSTGDVTLVRTSVGNAIVSVSDARDVDKDRRISTNDVSFVRARVSNNVLLRTITVPASGSGEEGEGPMGLTTAAWYGVTAKTESGARGTVAESRRPSITARWSDEVFDVPLPKAMLAAIAEVRSDPFQPFSDSSQEGTAKDWEPLSLDGYFANSTRKNGLDL